MQSATTMEAPPRLESPPGTRRHMPPSLSQPKRGSAVSKRKNRSCDRSFLLEAPPRLELGNRGFAVRCLTTWLWRHISFAGITRKTFFDGAAYEARTRYLHLGKVALYRMS